MWKKLNKLMDKFAKKDLLALLVQLKKCFKEVLANQKIFKNFHKKTSLFGIDYDGETLKVLELAKSPKDMYNIVECVVIPVSDAEQNDLAVFSQKAKINFSSKNKSSVIALPSSAIIAKSIPITGSLKKNEIEDFLHFNTEKYLGCQFTDINLDYRESFKGLGKEKAAEIKIVAVRKEKINNFIALFKKANIYPKIVDVDIFALVRSIQWLYAGLNMPYAVINIDKKRCLFCVICDKEIIHYQANYNLALNSIVISTAQIFSQLQMYAAAHKNQLQKIILTGTLANQELLKEISKITETRVIIADFGDKLLVQNNQQSMMICLGLALRKFDEKKQTDNSFNLLPWREEQKIKNYSFCSKACIALFCLFFIFAYIAQTALLKQIKNTARNILNLEQKQNSLKQRLNKIYLFRQEEQVLNKKIQFLQNLQDENKSKINSLIELSKIIPRDVLLKNLHIQDQTLQIQGQAKNQQAIVNLMSNSEYGRYLFNPEIVNLANKKQTISEKEVATAVTNEFMINLKIK